MGAIYAYFLEAIAPASVFDPNFDIAIALMAFMGGLGTLAGPVLGAVIVEPAQQYFALQFGASGWYLVLYGALFLGVILLLPEGIIPTARKRWARWTARRAGAGTAPSMPPEAERPRQVAAAGGDGGDR